MATREAVYREFGRAAELAQLLETEIGNFRPRRPRNQEFFEARRGHRAASDAIDKQTLTLKQMAARLKLAEDLAILFEGALETRNLFAPSVLPQHGLAILDGSGRNKMALHLVKIQVELQRAYSAAQHMSELLVKSVMLLKKVRH